MQCQLSITKCISRWGNLLRKRIVHVLVIFSSWLCNEVKTFDRLLIFFFVFLIPFAVKVRIKSEWAINFGHVNDYILPEISLIDMCIGALCFYFLCNIRKKSAPKISLYVVATLLLFIILSFLSGNNALEQRAWAYRWIKTVEWCALILVTPPYLWQTLENASNAYRVGLQKTFLYLSTFLATVGTLQFLFQQSVLPFIGKYLGEPNLVLWEREISYVPFGSWRLIRAYGVFPHPNIFGIFLVISVIVLLAGKYLFSKKIWNIIFAIHLVALLCTFSRTAWMLTVLVLGIWTWKQNSTVVPWITTYWKRIVLWGLVPVLIIGYRFVLLGSTNTTSWTERIQLLATASAMIEQNPVFGVGLGNFTLVLRDYDFTGFSTRYQQPVHNAFVLATSEVGILGGLVYLLLWIIPLYWLVTKLKKEPKDTYTLAIFLALLTLFLAGQVDHFLWTSQWGLVVSGVVLGMGWKRVSE